MKKNDFQMLIQKFFIERLMKQQKVSPCTVQSYKDTFRIFLKYIYDQLGIKADEVEMDTINSTTVIGFLNYLEDSRKNKCKTVNNRLAAIKAFMEYVSYECPEYLGIIHKVKALPFRKIEKKEVCYLCTDEIDSLLNACEIENCNGKRDYLMVLLLYNSGMRVSEMISIQGKDILTSSTGQCHLRIMGKGRNVQHLTRSGVRYRLDCIAKKASLNCSTLEKKSITPHVFRHSTAMSLLQAEIDISTIAIWLGHESIETTHKYMVADLKLKENALKKLHEPQINCSDDRYHATDDILKFLNSL